MHPTSRVVRRSGTLLSALVIAAGACFALPGAAGGQARAEDSVSANGTVGIPCAFIDITAQSGPSGENPTGEVICSGFFGGPVTCLNVQGNVALLNARTELGSVALRVTDNGPAGTDVVEAVIGSGCAQPQIAYLNLGFQGAAVVVDAQPLPTSKDQCKNGGWRGFGDTFKNQGQCVAFVQRGPQP